MTREEWTSTSLPVLTIGSLDRLDEQAYRERCATRLVEIALDLESYIGITRAAPRGAGARGQPARPHDLRLEAFPVLLPAHSRPPDALRRTRRILPRHPRESVRERADPAPRDAARLPAAARCAG